MTTRHSEKFTDTDPRAMEVWMERLRQMTPSDRLASALQLTELAYAMSEAEVLSISPNLTPRQVRLEAAARHLPPELISKIRQLDGASR